MAAIINHLQKALRHHAPLIHFRYGVNHTDAHPSEKSSGETKDHSDATTSTSSSPATTKQVKSTRKSVTLEFSQTPSKYRRRPLTQDEMDLVTIGGFT